MDSKKINAAAKEYADTTQHIPLVDLDEVDDADLIIRNMRFMSFAAGYRAGYEAAKAEQAEGKEAGEE